MCRRSKTRKGAVLVLSAIFMVILFTFIAFSVDLGYLTLTRTQLQCAADSAAMAAAWDLVAGNNTLGKTSTSFVASKARATASDYAQRNAPGNLTTALAASDTAIGRLEKVNGVWTVDESSASTSNAVRVRIRRTADQNGEVPLFFARVLGINSQSSQAEATAAFIDSISGFRLPSNSGNTNVNLLPFALDKETWDNLLKGAGQDEWSWNSETNEVRPGADGILEVNLYPQGTGSPGNRGTVDIGNPNNSTKDLSRQIRDGISAQDLEYLGGALQFNSEGKLYLNGDTGISAGVKDDLASIIGKPRILPIFSQVSGNGNNATYTIVQFVGVRLLEVKLTGSMDSKRVMIQPASVMAVGGIPSSQGQSASTYVYSPVRLVK